MMHSKKAGFHRYILVLLVMSLLVGCGGNGFDNVQVNQEFFEHYWHQGEAEINRFQLQQARYGQIHEGDAVMVFVTENFLKDKQIKHEYGDGESYPVLKMNLSKKFITGIYPYSIMTSVFTRLDADGKPLTVKASNSAQEWCGQTYTQLNRNGKKYRVTSHSYFQAEGDENFKLTAAILEDELWTRIRINPKTLPLGSIKVIPGMEYARLGHHTLKREKAEATLDKKEETAEAKPTFIYTLQYQDINRTLRIVFEQRQPFRILEWEETYPSGPGEDAELLTTRAVKTHGIMLDYWNKNKTEDRALRDQLGLPR